MSFWRLLYRVFPIALALTVQSNSADSSSPVDWTNATLIRLNSRNSTPTVDLQQTGAKNCSTTNSNFVSAESQGQIQVGAVTSPVQLQVASTTLCPKNTTQAPVTSVPIRLNVRSRINQLLDAIDNRLKNASMLLDPHVFVLQNANSTMNVTRTWSFPPTRLKNVPNTTFSRLSSHVLRLSNGQPRGVSFRRQCEHLTEQQKYARLKGVGGLNQQYMANTPIEAARNFPRLLSVLDDPSSSMLSSKTMFSDASDMNRSVDPIACDEQCEEIRSKLEEVLLEDNSNRSVTTDQRQMFDGGTSEDESATSDDTESLSEPTLKPRRRGCRLERFVSIGNCTSRGEEEFWDYEKLCTACQGVYMLSNDCFPTFLNSIVCDKHETSCIFDRYTGVSQGKCRTKKLNFKVMQNKGSKDCEDWTFVYLEVPVACECYLSKTSWLNAVPH